MNKILVVDGEDKVIGSKDISTLTYEDIYRVSGLWIKNSKGQILLAKRAYTKKKDPGMWGPAVAGTVEEGESYESNIIKEAEEELGLQDIRPEKGPKTRIKSKHNHFTQWFFLNVDKNIEEFRIDEREVAEIKWFSKEEILEIIKNNPEEIVESFREAMDLLLKH